MWAYLQGTVVACCPSFEVKHLHHCLLTCWAHCVNKCTVCVGGGGGGGGGGRGLRLLFVHTTLSCKDKVSIVACRGCWAEGCLSLRTNKPWWSTAFNRVLSPESVNGVEGGAQTSVCCTPCNEEGQLCLPSSTVLAGLRNVGCLAPALSHLFWVWLLLQV